MTRILIHRLSATAIGAAALFSLTGCIPFLPKPRVPVGTIATPYEYVAAKTPDGIGQIRVAFDPRSPQPPTWWRLVDSDGPCSWRPVRREGKAEATTERAEIYLLQFRANRAIPPESRTVTLLEKQCLNLKVQYKK